jgi:hypothetical protein
MKDQTVTSINFYSNDHLAVKSSSMCEILNPLSEEGTDLSDHFPLSCFIHYEPVSDPVTTEG